MSAFDIDDLISSFTSNHIGQEAHDLAALQTQLRQSLGMYNGFPSSPTPNAKMSGFAPSTTPTARSPLTSTNMMMFDDGSSRMRSMSISRQNVSRDRSLSTHRTHQSELTWGQQTYDMEEDDYMSMSGDDNQYDTSYDAPGVWHHAGSSSSASKPLSSTFPRQNAPVASRGSQPYFDPHANSYAAYAAVDPFFAAQLNATQQQPQSAYFAQQQSQPTPAQFVSARYQ